MTLRSNFPFTTVDSPTPAQIREARIRAGRTQLQAADLLRVSERQFQRWETEGGMPAASWRRFSMTCGHRFQDDFAVHGGDTTRSWALDRDTPRAFVQNGDRVLLQPVNGPQILVRVWLDRVQGVNDDEAYGGIVIDFPTEPDAGPEFGGFFLGERVTFAKRNIMHIEQAPPRPPAVSASERD